MSGIDEDRRTSFSSVASAYDRARPSYPSELVADVCAFAGAKHGSRALEVGSGTGKATVLFAARGLKLDAIEPSAEMTEVASANPALAKVDFQIAKFEDAVISPDSFKLIYSAQAWHWVEPVTGERVAAAALMPGGALACFWNTVVWQDNALADALAGAYDSVGWLPRGPMNPRTPLADFAPSWRDRVDQVAGLGEPEFRRYDWTAGYSTAEYIALLGTHSDHVLLDEARRIQLYGAVAGVIEEAGGRLDLVYSSQLCLARAAA